MENIIPAVVIVPKLSLGCVVPDAKLQPLAHGQRGRREGEGELVREAVAATLQIRRVKVRGFCPVVERILERHLFMEAQIDDANGTLDSGRPRHEAVLEADLLRVEQVEKVGEASWLVEHGHERGRRQRRIPRTTHRADEFEDFTQLRRVHGAVGALRREADALRVGGLGVRGLEVAEVGVLEVGVGALWDLGDFV